MLILTRKPGQNVVINDNVIVKILEVKGDQIKIGIVAPKDVEIYREEVFIAIKEANQSAAVSSKDILSLSLPNTNNTLKKRDK